MDGRDYEALFTKVPEPGDDHSRWLDGITRQRVRTTHAGQVLYVDSYPVYTSAMMRQAREITAKRKPMRQTCEAMRRVHANHARRKLAALCNLNFGPGDLLMTLTYRPDDQNRPATAEDAKRDVAAYLRGVNAQRKKRGLDNARYVYVIETTESKKHGRQHHCHLLIGGDGMTELELRAMWRKRHPDARVATDCVWDRPEGLSSWAAYVTKADDRVEDEATGQTVETAKRWYRSANLKKPQTTVADTKLSRTRAERIARDFDMGGREIMEKIYRGYQVLDLYVKTSDWLPGAYIYAVMAKKEDVDAARGKAAGADKQNRPGRAGGGAGAE